MFPGKRYDAVDLLAVLDAVAAKPDALHDLEPGLGRQRRDLILTVVDRIGSHAGGNTGQLGEVFGHLLRADAHRRIKRRLQPAIRRVGDAVEPGCGIDRRARQIDRLGYPPPHAGNDTQGNDEERGGRAKGRQRGSLRDRRR